MFKSPQAYAQIIRLVVQTGGIAVFAAWLISI